MGIQFLVLFSRTIGTPSKYIVHAPPCFWHRTRGFLEARHSWEPGSSLTTSELSLFRLLPKVSAVNVHWTEHDSYLSNSQIFLDWHFLAWPWPSQATQFSPGMESPKGYPNSWIGWLLLVLWQLSCTSLKVIVRAFLTTKSFAVGSSTYPCHIRGGIHKKISALEKIAKKVPRVFFQNWCSGTYTKVRSGCRRSPPPRQCCRFPSHQKLTPLASNAHH